MASKYNNRSKEDDMHPHESDSNKEQPVTPKRKRKRPKELQTDISMATDRNKGITVPCTEEQYEEIIKTLWYGSYTIRKNRTVAVILQTEANTGLRIGDIVLRLRLSDIIFDNGRYRFHLREHKTGKLRIFTVPNPVYNMLWRYAKAHNIKQNEPLFNMTVRNVQKKLDQVTDYLGFRYVSTHSFRKFFACRCYEAGNHDINLVRTLLQHADTATTIRYLGVSDDRIERVLRKVVNIVESYWDEPDDEGEDSCQHVEQNRLDLIPIKCSLPKQLIAEVYRYLSQDEQTMASLVEEAIMDYLERHSTSAEDEAESE